MRQVITVGVIGVALLMSGALAWAATDQEDGSAPGHHHMGMMGSHDQQEHMSGQQEHGDHQQQPGDMVYVCPMHPEVRKAEPGRCPVCGMNLEAQPVEPTEEGPEHDASESHQHPETPAGTQSSGHHH